MTSTKLNIIEPKSSLGEAHGVLNADRLIRELGFEERRISLKDPSTKYCLSMTGHVLKNLGIVTVSPNMYVDDSAGPLESIQVFMPLKGKLSHWNDNKVFDAIPGQGLIFSPGQLVNLKWSPDSKALVVHISADAVSAYIEQHVHSPIGIPLTFDNPYLSSISHSWLTVVEGLCEEIDSDSSLLLQGITVKNWLDLAISTILHTKQNSLVHFIDSNSRNAIPIYVKKALHFIDTNLDEDISRDDLLEISGAKLRTLHFGFRQYLGMTPMHYIKRSRLRKVREELIMGSPETTTIHDIAAKWGFTNGSSFAHDYKLLFDELPSQTLRNLSKPDKSAVTRIEAQL